MQGRRVDEVPADGDQWPFPRLQPGDYGKNLNGGWRCVPPGTNMLGNLDAHTITEHDDGTITVSPSILITGGGSWHGYLEKGIWRQV